MHSLSGSKPGTAEPIGTLGIQMVEVGGIHDADLEIQGFQSYYSLIQKAHLMQEEFLPCKDVSKRPTPLISIPLSSFINLVLCIRSSSRGRGANWA